MFFFKKYRGFTIIELLVVVAIIGLLSSLVLVNTGEARARARDARRKNDLKQIQTALEIFHVDYEYYPNEGNCDDYICASYCWCWDDATYGGSYIFKDLYNAGLISFLPKDPVSDSTYYYQYEPGCHIDGEAQYYDLRVRLETTGQWHIITGGIPTNSPQCDTTW